MRRLPEQFDPTDPNEAYGAALLAKVARLEPSTAHKRRVWVALQERPLRRPMGRSSAAVAGGLVLCGATATAAGAAISHYWTSWHGADTTAAAAAPALPVPPAPPRPAPVEPRSQHVESAPAPAKVVPSKPRTVDAVEPSAALMVEAMRARKTGNFARVRELSSEYRGKYPGGALNEEALALSIEAAAALGDADAPRLAAQYLQNYPQGRFRGQAQRALGASR
ncbi:MAG TPA: hypothetical protein VK550_24275 [Polyangiaceae bacterium]|nr:hypothetical protein [Polyangiaceae bacterium]